MKRNRIVITLLNIMMVASSFAGGMGVEEDSDSCWGTSGSCWGRIQDEPYPWSKLVSISAGPGWNNGGSTQTILLQSNLQKLYQADGGGSALFTGNVLLGLQKQLSESLYTQFGLQIAASSNATFQGNIWEDADPDFNNYRYEYKVNHLDVGVKGILLTDVNRVGRPYVSASLGVGFNNAHDFTITPKIFQEVPAPAFTSNTTTAFSYTVGLGIMRVINKNWQAGLGYQFAAWGQSSLDKAPGQTFNNGLFLSNIYVNSAQFSITYLS